MARISGRTSTGVREDEHWEVGVPCHSVLGPIQTCYLARNLIRTNNQAELEEEDRHTRRIPNPHPV